MRDIGQKANSRFHDQAGKEGMIEAASYYRYWGKADKEAGSDVADYHLMVYHSLDVVAVAAQWLHDSPVLLRHFSAIGGTAVVSEMRGWILFFIALHDLGKFDVRFQLKARVAFQDLNPGLKLRVADGSAAWQYWHGEHAFHWLCVDFNDRFKWKSDHGFELAEGEEIWKQWEPWLRAVAGHHGVEPQPGADPKFPVLLDPTLVDMDRKARIAFVEQMADLFLQPAGLSLDSPPPPCNLIFLAGFCCVCDWLGSAVRNQQDEARFTYVMKSMPLQDYLAQRQPVAFAVLKDSGLRAHTVHSFGMGGLFPDFERPHQVQTLVPDLPGESGFTLMEAPTGSG
jgi:CRISPR-associated endonuclease/helicase Cas3